MSEYYLLSQLPTLYGLSPTAPLPITEERFLTLCRRFLTGRALAALENITLVPPPEPEKASYPFLTAYYEAERRLRLALVALRQEKRGGAAVSPAPGDRLWEVARTAVEMSDPLLAEEYLLAYRLGVLDERRPADPFSTEAVFHYAITLRLLCRQRRFQKEAGLAAYRTIYSSIRTEEEKEATI